MATIQIKGMSCKHCVASVTSALQGISGISDVNVDLDRGEASYQGDVDEQQVAQAVAAIGFEVVQAE